MLEIAGKKDDRTTVFLKINYEVKILTIHIMA